MKLSNINICASFALSLLVSFSSYAAEVEVLHYWTSGGEAKSVAELKKILESKGHTWKDFAVAGGGGESAATVLKSRVVSGKAPAAAQIKGPTIQEWGEEGVLADISDIAEAEKWDELLPEVVSDVMKYDGKYVAVPVNVHRVNWMWANPALLAQVGASVPTTWDEFFAAADKLKAAGITAVAHGGQAWQEATTFELVVLGTAGPAFYNRAFVELDPQAIQSPEMTRALNTFRKIKQYTDEGAPGRDWNLATAMVIEGKAAMQFMGDWAKGEFSVAGKKPGTDYICAPSPGTAQDFVFNIDSFAMFDLDDEELERGQNDLAAAILSPEFQEVFNLNKGSIPVRLGQSMDKFDDCAKLASKDFVASAQAGSLVPSMAHGMSTYAATQGAIYDTVTEFYNNDDITAEAAAEKMLKAIAAAE